MIRAADQTLSTRTTRQKERFTMSKKRSLALLAPIGLTLSLALTACGGSGGGSSAAPVPADCKPKSQFTTVKKGTLTVAGFVSPPSVINANTSGGTDLTGADSEVVDEFAKENCLQLAETTTSPTAGLGNLQTGRIDVLIGGIGYTPERAASFGTSKPLYDVYLDAVSKTGISSIDQMTSSSVTGVGLVEGYRWQDDFQKVLGSKVKVYQTPQQMLSDLVNGRIQVATMDSTESGYYLDKMGNSGMTAVHVSPDPRVADSKAPAAVVALFPKASTGVQDAFNAVVDGMNKDGSLAAILKKYNLTPASGS